jgi:DNA-binding MarR family transcriptional regulator
MKNESGKLARQVYDGWIGVDTAFRLKIMPVISESTITFAQFEILFAIHHFGSKKPSVKDLATFTLKSSSAVTQLVAGLEKDNLVNHVRSTTDRRIVYITLTDEGHKAYNDLDSVLISSLQDVISGLSKQEVKDYIRINNKIAETVK